MTSIIDKISAAIAFLIFGSSILLYVTALIQKPFETVATLGLSAFALVAAVSGLCFAMAQVLEDEKSTVLYSGEKMLHSTVLILQTVVLKYASEAVLATSFLRSHETVMKVVSWASNVLLVLISSYAAYFFLYGFEALHDLLWNRFHVRKQELHRKPPKAE